jgi:hypothetical protein
MVMLPAAPELDKESPFVRSLFSYTRRTNSNSVSIFVIFEE